MDVQITMEDYERWIGQLYIQTRQLEKAIISLDKEDKKGVVIEEVII